ARLAAGERCYGTMAFEFFTPGLTALLAGCGCDFVILDMEHSGAGIDTIKRQIAYARGLPIEVWVRVPEKSYAAVATVLDAGARGIMAPMLETPEEAGALVEWARYRPQGGRGLAFGIGHDGYLGQDPVGTMAAANERNVLIALIESRRGIDNAEAILATPGIDVGWLGHFDLTSDLGIPAAFGDPAFLTAVDRLVAAGARTGKPLGILDADPDLLRAFAGGGFRALGWASDLTALRTAMGLGIELLRGLPGGPGAGG
ncbi:MAG TPA: aldolase/citrate lyase family protein, partial [Geminicoccaceae bacterium]|nr:aldolase/citrate lyase family protein [Geminicoccaceae bacterium]